MVACSYQWAWVPKDKEPQPKAAAAKKKKGAKKGSGLGAEITKAHWGTVLICAPHDDLLTADNAIPVRVERWVEMRVARAAEKARREKDKDGIQDTRTNKTRVDAFVKGKRAEAKEAAKL